MTDLRFASVRVETEVRITERKVLSRPGVLEEWVRTEEQLENESGAPYIEETITTRRTYTDSSKPVETTTTRIHTELVDSSSYAQGTNASNHSFQGCK